MNPSPARMFISVAALATVGSLLISAPVMAKTPVACGKPVAAANGTHGPVLCPDGAPNSQMRGWLKMSAPNLMALNAKATYAQIRTAACADVATKNATGPLVTDAYTYQFARFDWAGKRLSPKLFDLRLGVEFNCGS